MGRDAAAAVAALCSPERDALARAYVRSSKELRAVPRPELAAASRASLKRCFEALPEQSKRTKTQPEFDLSDSALSRTAWMTDSLQLAPYANFFHLAPRLVNCVTLGEATAEPGTGTVLPLNLRSVASKLTNAYFAPRRFAAIQLSYAAPRSRVLLFRALEPNSNLDHARACTKLPTNKDACSVLFSDTGRLVGTPRQLPLDVVCEVQQALCFLEEVCPCRQGRRPPRLGEKRVCLLPRLSLHTARAPVRRNRHVGRRGSPTVHCPRGEPAGSRSWDISHVRQVRSY